MISNTRNYASFVFVLLALVGAMLACSRPALPDDPSFRVPGQIAAVQDEPLHPPTRTPFIPSSRLPGEPIYTPTPDDPHRLPALRTEPDQYMVQAGDALGLIAQRYGITMEQLVKANSIPNPDLLEVGQVLNIPIPDPQGDGPDFKVIPDSELVFGPASVDFDVPGFINSQGGFLSRYTEEVDEKTLTGAQIVLRISQDYSVNPRLLLAVLQYQSEWLTRSETPKEGKLEYPIGVREKWRAGLYRQLAWAANNLNRGFYMWRVSGVSTWLLADGSVVRIAPTINAGTAGIQNLFSSLYGRSEWEQALGEKGVFATYNALFGYPFDYSINNLIPDGLRQPTLQLPFEPDVLWSFTGGPHGGWGDGSAWAALDFAPPMDILGCNISREWVVAVTDGLITRSSDGAVMQDLDGDGLEQTGWVVLYMHIASLNRIQAGAYVRAGERIGHPSCEGGVANGTHVHIARRYNGEWIPADQTLPFIMDEWVSRGAGKEYDGYLERNGHVIEAWDGQLSQNALQR